MFLKISQNSQENTCASLFSVFSPNAGKYGPEKTSYLDTFYSVWEYRKDMLTHSQLPQHNEKGIRQIMEFFLQKWWVAFNHLRLQKTYHGDLHGTVQVVAKWRGKHMSNI